jgi:hypothetical protein
MKADNIEVRPDEAEALEALFAFEPIELQGADAEQSATASCGSMFDGSHSCGS